MRPNNFNLRRTGAIVLCLAAAMFAASCGGNASKKKAADGATETEQTETKAPKGSAMVSKYTKAEDYTAGALAKMASLGKTEKDKRLVTVGGDEDHTVYTVRTFEGGKCTDNSKYEFCKTSINPELFAAYKEFATEVNDADKWTHTSYGDDTGDWQSWYDAAKKIENLGNKVLE